MVALATEREDVLCLSGDLTRQCDADLFQNALPERFVHAGTAEAKMMSMAGALAREGLQPWVHTFGAYGLVPVTTPGAKGSAYGQDGSALEGPSGSERGSDCGCRRVALRVVSGPPTGRGEDGGPERIWWRASHQFWQWVGRGRGRRDHASRPPLLTDVWTEGCRP
ncbi:hypothetical protein [Nocardioides sp.]|uniref:hypothetical protein n=1 Tax=Nocardioides sp. TaxID=35761 RepID=UPI0039E4D8BB